MPCVEEMWLLYTFEESLNSRAASSAWRNSCVHNRRETDADAEPSVAGSFTCLKRPCIQNGRETDADADSNVCSATTKDIGL